MQIMHEVTASQNENTFFPQGRQALANFKARTEALVNDIEDEQVKVRASTEDGTVTAHLRITAARLALKI